MIRFFTVLTSLLIVFAMIMILSCENDYPPSIYDPNKKGLPNPIINSVEPPSVALAGVTKITILGSNFASDISKIIVYFNASKGDILEASDTRIVVRAPILVADSVLIRVAVQGAELFGVYNKKYKLLPAQAPVTKFAPVDEPWGITTDAEGNIYTSMVVSNAGVGIRKIDLNGVVTNWAPKGGETFYNSLKMGPNKTIYAARKQKAIFTVTEGQKGVVFVSSGLGTITDIDFDQYKNIWGVGNNDKIYRVSPTKNVKAFDFKADLRSVRVFNNYVYVAGKKDNLEKVWRFPITGDGEVGQAEEYFDFTTATGNSLFIITAITFALDGDMYVGTDAPAAVYIVHPDKSMEPLYPGQLFPKTSVFSWGKDPEGNYCRLLVTREKTASNAQSLIWVNMQKDGAPYYGIK